MSDTKKTGLLADPFCIYPFTSINVMPSGQVKPCCVYSTPIHQDAKPMSVYEHTLDEIWNSQEMRTLRRDLATGKPAKGCSYCYKQEALGITSMGTTTNREWASRYPQVDRSNWEKDDYVMRDGIASLDLDVGNLCNLKCRMCNSSYSSAIASDPVHSRWAPPGPVAARWRGDASLIAPAQVLGVTYSGLAYPEREDGTLRSWIAKDAHIKASVYGVGVSGFSVQLFAEPQARVTIYANDVVVAEETLAGPFERRFDMPDFASAAYLDIRIAVAGGRVAVEAVKLLRPARGNSKMVFSRLAGGDQWFQSEEFMTGELLENPDNLRVVRIIGGEPLLIKEARAFVRHLIALGVAHNIILGVATNGTQADEEWIEMFSHFRLAVVNVSVDGVAGVNDYIRFPADWATIDATIRTLVAKTKVTASINMTVQAYNALDITEVVEYCEERGITFGYHLLQHPPYLGVGAMPDAARQLAVARLTDYVARRNAETPDWAYAGALNTLAAAMARERFSAEQNAQFWTFTREMDRSRNQDIAVQLPEVARAMLTPAAKNAGYGGRI